MSSVLNNIPITQTSVTNDSKIDFTEFSYVNIVANGNRDGPLSVNDQNLIDFSQGNQNIEEAQIDTSTAQPLTVFCKVSNNTTPHDTHVDYDNQMVKISSDLFSNLTTISGTQIPLGYTLIANSSGYPQWQYVTASGSLILDPAKSNQILWNNASELDYLPYISNQYLQNNSVSGQKIVDNSLVLNKLQPNPTQNIKSFVTSQSGSVSYSQIINSDITTPLDNSNFTSGSISGTIIQHQSQPFSTLNNVPIILSGISQLSVPTVSGSLMLVNSSGGVSYSSISGFPISLGQIQPNNTGQVQYLQSVSGVNQWAQPQFNQISGTINTSTQIQDNSINVQKISGNITNNALYLKSISGINSFDQVQLSEVGTNQLLQNLNTMSSTSQSSVILVSGQNTSYQPVSSITIPYSNITSKPQLISDLGFLNYSGAIDGYVLTTSGSSVSWQAQAASSGSVNWTSISGIPSNISQLASLSGVLQDSVLKINSSGVESWQSISGLQVQYPLLQNKPTSLDNMTNVSGKNRQFYMVISGVGQYVDLTTFTSGYQNNLINSRALAYTTPNSLAQIQSDGSWGTSNSFIKSSLLYTNVGQNSVQYLNNANNYQCPVIFPAQSGSVLQEPIIYQNALDGIYVQQSGIYQTINANGTSYLPYIGQSGLSQTSLSGNGILSVQSGVIGFTSFSSNSMVTTSSSGSLTTMNGVSGFVLLPYFQSDNTIQKRTMPAGQIPYSDGSSIQPLSLGASSNYRILTYSPSNTISSLDMGGSSTSVIKGDNTVAQINTIAIANTSSTTITYKPSLTNSSLLQGLELKNTNSSVTSMLSQFGLDMYAIVSTGTFNLWGCNNNNVFASGVTYVQRGYFSTSNWQWVAISDEKKKQIHNEYYKEDDESILREISSLRFRKWSYLNQAKEYYDYNGQLQPRQKRHISPCYQDLIKHKFFKNVCTNQKREDIPNVEWADKVVDWTFYNILVSMAVKQLTKKVFKLENRLQRLERIMNIQEQQQDEQTRKPRSQSPDSPEFIIIDKE